MTSAAASPATASRTGLLLSARRAPRRIAPSAVSRSAHIRVRCSVSAVAGPDVWANRLGAMQAIVPTAAMVAPITSWIFSDREFGILLSLLALLVGSRHDRVHTFLSGHDRTVVELLVDTELGESGRRQE